MSWTGAIRSEGLAPAAGDSARLAGAVAARPWPRTIRDFEVLVEDLQHRLVQFAFCRLQSREDAEDVVQDVLVQAYRDREKHRAVDHADPFLFRMVANRCTDVVRRRKRQAGAPAVEPAAPGENPCRDAAAAAARLRQIEVLLDRLPSRQAEVLRLRVYGGLPFDAVAQAIGCGVPTVKSRFRYGVQKLRKALRRQGGGR